MRLPRGFKGSGDHIVTHMFNVAPAAVRAGAGCYKSVSGRRSSSGSGEVECIERHRLLGKYLACVSHVCHESCPVFLSCTPLAHLVCTRMSYYVLL